jgi:hypothetical protein
MLLSQVIIKLLIDHDDLPNLRESAVQENIKKIGKLVDRDKLIWQDIIASRNEYFPTCTKCKQKYPNTDEFWALLEYKDDQSKTRWFLCRSCAQKQLNGEIK